MRRIALALVDGDEALADEVAGRLVGLGGAAIAPANRFSERRERNRDRRQRRAARQAAVALPLAERIAVEMLDELLKGKRVYTPWRDRSRAALYWQLPERLRRKGLR